MDTYKALAATALLLDVGIVEDKLARDLVLLPVHLAPYYTEEGLTIYENLHTVLLNNFIELAGLVDVFEVIGHTRAAFVAHPDPDKLGRRRVQQAC